LDAAVSITIIALALEAGRGKVSGARAQQFAVQSSRLVAQIPHRQFNFILGEMLSKF